MSLNDFIANESKAKIVGVKIMPLREGIAEEHWAAWTKYDVEGKPSKLDRDHYAISYDDQGFERTEFFLVPKSKRGYMKSNIKAILEKNGFSAEPEKWEGVIDIVYDKEGYVSIAR